MEIAQDLMCPVCQGQSVGESNSELAQDMRSVIRSKLEAGESREQIKQYFVARYGESILGAPPPKGSNLLLWLLPIGLLLVGGVLIGAFIRHSKTGVNNSTQSGGENVATPSSESETYYEKLEKDLDEFDK